jgi:hypothetical protein
MEKRLYSGPPNFLNPTLTIVVIVIFTAMFTGLVVAAYVKCKNIIRYNQGQSADDHDVEADTDDENNRGRPQAPVSVSSSTSTSRFTDTLNSSGSTSTSVAGLVTGNRFDGLAKRIRDWSAETFGSGRNKEPRLTISVLGQIYEKEWSMHRNKTDQFSHREFDSVSGNGNSEDHDDDDDVPESTLADKEKSARPEAICCKVDEEIVEPVVA